MVAISSAPRIVESRCAITSVVRPRESSSSDSWTACSLSLSSALVASSKIRIGGFLRKTRAIAMRCFWPPERWLPRSPTCVS